MSLVAFVLIVYGITNILVNESIFRKQIDWLKTKNQFLNDVLSCSTCLSTYIGVVLFLVAPITLSGIFLLDILLAGLLSSGAINLIEQIKNRMFE
jgi:Na+/alanine symporter